MKTHILQPVDSTSDTATRVLVAVPSSTVRAGLRAFVEAEPEFEFAGDVGDAQWLLWAFRTVQPDTLVVDWALPGGSIARIVECVRHYRPDTRVVMLGSGPWQEPSARAAGADSFVWKGQPPDVLRAALRDQVDRQN